MKPVVAPGRVIGLDVARALALVGMMATHILPAFDLEGLTVSQQLAGGRASALFAVLAGVSIALMTDRSSAPEGRRWLPAATGLGVRALLIALVGLFLGEVDSDIAVILTYYGVLFLLALPFLRLPARTLALLAVGWLLVVPVLSHMVRPHLPAPTYLNPALSRLTDPWPLLSELTFTGYYPAVPWVAYLLAGMAVGRTDLARWRTTTALAVTGAGMAAAGWLGSALLLSRPGVIGTLRDTFTGPGARDTMELTLERGLYGTTPTGSWWWLAVRAPHTATPFELVHTIGTSLVVIAVCVAAGRLFPRLLAVVFGAGAMTLTLYSAHVVLRAKGVWDADGTATFVGQGLLALLVGAAYRAARRRGPLETGVATVSGAARQVVTSRDVRRARAR
jgi:uncharacterized membrane protein